MNASRQVKKVGIEVIQGMLDAVTSYGEATTDVSVTMSALPPFHIPSIVPPGAGMTRLSLGYGVRGISVHRPDGQIYI